MLLFKVLYVLLINISMITLDVEMKPRHPLDPMGQGGGRPHFI